MNQNVGEVINPKAPQNVKILTIEPKSARFFMKNLTPEMELNGDLNKERTQDYVINFSISSSDSTLMNFCLFNFGSLDQIGDLSNDSDKAKSGESFGCGNISLALDKCSSYLSLGTDLTMCLRNINKSSNSDSDILDEFKIFSFNEDNSEYTKSGVIRLKPALLNCLTNLKTLDFLKKENKILVSNISNIFYKPCLLATLCFNSSANSLAFSSESFDLEAIFSASSNNISSFTSSSNALSRALLTTLSQFNSFESFKASSSNPSGISTFNSVILSTPIENDESDYLNVSIDFKVSNLFLYSLYNDSLTFFPNFKASFSVNLDLDTIALNKRYSLTFSAIALRAISDQFSSGIESISCFKSSGTAKVSVGILIPPFTFNTINYVNYVYLHKLFDLEVAA